MTPPPPPPILEKRNFHIKKKNPIGSIQLIRIFKNGLSVGFLPVKSTCAAWSLSISVSSVIWAVYKVFPLYSSLSSLGVINKLSLVITTLEISLLSSISMNLLYVISFVVLLSLATLNAITNANAMIK